MQYLDGIVNWFEGLPARVSDICWANMEKGNPDSYELLEKGSRINGNPEILILMAHYGTVQASNGRFDYIEQKKVYKCTHTAIYNFEMYEFYTRQQIDDIIANNLQTVN